MVKRDCTALNVPALQEATVGCERMVIDHLRLGKVHWMTCFQCMLSKGRGGYISFLQGTPVSKHYDWLWYKTEVTLVEGVIG